MLGLSQSFICGDCGERDGLGGVSAKWDGYSACYLMAPTLVAETGNASHLMVAQMVDHLPA